MKLHLFASFLLLAATLGAQAQDYTLRTLTFEDSDYKGDGTTQCTGQANWSSLIDSTQYGGKLLYGTSGYGESECFYYWSDDANTMLAHKFPQHSGFYIYWYGGHAVSNYVSGDFTTYGDFNSQLTVYKKGVSGLARTGGGHNGSNNFCIHFGYHDNSGYSSSSLPSLYFADGVARVIDHMWVNNTCYADNCYLNGNGLTAKIGDSDWVKIVATGFDAQGSKTDSVEIYLVNGPKNIVTDWTKFDLSPLGAVTKVEFNIKGISDNGYVFSQPAYFAYDDVAVRFPGNVTGVSDAHAAKQVQSVTYFNLAGQQSNKPFIGLNVVRTTYADGTTATAKQIMR